MSKCADCDEDKIYCTVCPESMPDIDYRRAWESLYESLNGKFSTATVKSIHKVMDDVLNGCKRNN